MNKVMNRTLVAFAAMFTVSAHANVDPSSLYVKVYQVWVSQNGLCTDAVKVIDNGDNPDYVDMLTNPQLGAGTLADGTYPCLMIKMSSLIKFKPSANDGDSCVAGTEYILDVCHDGNSYQNPESTATAGTCSATEGAEETITLHLSTFSSNTNGDAWNKPTSEGDASHGFNLGSALVVSGSTMSTFIVDGVQSPKIVSDEGASCGMQPPTFSFR